MNDLEIEECVRAAMSKFNKIFPENRLLTEAQDKAIVSYWVSNSNMWGYNSALDALSCVLVSKNPEPYKKGYEDLAMATLCEMFDRNLGWVRSFQDGWFGRDNRSTSITGYILGRKFRLEYLKAE